MSDPVSHRCYWIKELLYRNKWKEPPQTQLPRPCLFSSRTQPTLSTTILIQLFPNPEHILSSHFLYFKLPLPLLSPCPSPGYSESFLREPSLQCINITAASVPSPDSILSSTRKGCVHQLNYQFFGGQHKNLTWWSSWPHRPGACSPTIHLFHPAPGMVMAVMQAQSGLCLLKHCF